VKTVTLALIIVFLVALCTVAVQPTNASSKTIIVLGDYPTINAAVENALDEDIWAPKSPIEWQIKISILSPLNQTYTATGISLNFTVSDMATWIRYSLDGQDNITVTVNTTLGRLAYGSHCLTVYVDDPFGNTKASDTIHFSIAEPELSPFRLFAIVLASVATATVIFVIYRIARAKRNVQKLKAEQS
jgi:hypothetical protein